MLEEFSGGILDVKQDVVLLLKGCIGAIRQRPRLDGI